MKKVAISVLIILSFNVYSQSTEVAKQWLLKNYNHEQNQKNQTKRSNSFLTEYCDYFMNGSQTDETQENKILFSSEIFASGCKNLPTQKPKCHLQ
jgi:hypothetical protein